MKTSFLAAAAVAALCLAAGCANIPGEAAIGTPQAQVLQKLGTPTATYPLASGTRLQYSGQPMGRQVFNIDIGADGKVASVTQALQAPVLDSFSGRSMTGEELRREIGPPAMVTEVGRFDGKVWTWRYMQMDIPRLFHAYIDPQGKVDRTLSTDEPIRPNTKG